MLGTMLVSAASLLIHIAKMSNARFKIEPFFFSSSLNWIPSRYQEDVRHKQGDRELLPSPLSVVLERFQIYAGVRYHHHPHISQNDAKPHDSAKYTCN
jgi:hypothetical protein